MVLPLSNQSEKLKILANNEWCEVNFYLKFDTLNQQKNSQPDKINDASQYHTLVINNRRLCPSY